MKLFLKLLVPWFWKPRELFQWGTMSLGWLRVLVRVWREQSKPAHVWTWRLWGQGVGISENEQYTAPTSESKLIHKQTRKAGVMLLTDYHREADPPPPPSLCFASRCVYHWIRYCSFLLSLGVQCVSVGQWTLLCPP